MNERRFRVEVDEHTIRHTVYEVEARSAKEARELVENGKGKQLPDETTEGDGEFDVRFVTDTASGMKKTY